MGSAKADQVALVAGEHAVSDAIDPLIGFRIWRGSRLPDRPRLSSAHHPTSWPTDGPLRATCLPWGSLVPLAHPAPAPRCGCGLYAFGSSEALDRYLGNLSVPQMFGEDLFYVAGVVLGWGRVALGADCWRAELGRPAGLLSAAFTGDPARSPAILDWIERAAAAYDVPVLARWPG